MPPLPARRYKIGTNALLKLAPTRKAHRAMLVEHDQPLSSSMPIRSFSSQLADGAPNRTVDNDAPHGLRQEYVDVVYFLFERLPSGFRESDEKRLYHVISQCLGIQPSGVPYSGFRYAISRDVSKADWQRFYDLIVRVATEIPQIFQSEHRALTNKLLASYGIAWELRDDNQLYRVIPQVILTQMDETFRELNQTRFGAALASFQAGMVAYNERPQRPRDACKNIFDALESVAKTLDNKPTGTFGDVLSSLRKSDFFAKETIGGLQKLYDLANSHFRHGMTGPFTLKSAEVDYVVVSCCGAMLLLIRA